MNDVDIKYAHFRRIDLNLLVAFDALLREGHVGRAAARLYIGQPAMSHALARLRELFGDELFIRSGKQMEPTARALALAPQIRSWLLEGASFLLDDDSFDPATAEGLLRISIPDGMEALIVPPLIARLRRAAPGVRLRTQLMDVDQLLSALDDDEVDLVIAAAGLPMRDWHAGQPLLRSGFNYLYSTRQLQLPQPATLADIAAQDHVASSYRGEAASVVDHYFASRGLARRVVLFSGSMIAIGQILREAPLVAIQPAIYTGLYQYAPDIVSATLSDAPALSIPIDLLWHRRNQRQPLHDYVRQQICAIGAELGSQYADSAGMAGQNG